MDIKNISNHQNGRLDGTDRAGKNRKSFGLSSKNSRENYTDKVSIERYPFRKNDHLFAKVELEKLNESSAGRMEKMKAKISEFEAARQAVPDRSGQTSIGKLLNDPQVREKIAKKINAH